MLIRAGDILRRGRVALFQSWPDCLATRPQNGDGSIKPVMSRGSRTAHKRLDNEKGVGRSNATQFVATTAHDLSIALPTECRMSPDLDQLLCNKYPKIFTDRRNPDSCMFRGFACGDGWFKLIDRLCFRIQSGVDAGDRPQPVAAQVKEKVGGLRIYWRDADELVRELTYFAGDLSEVTCELCGAPGERVEAPRRVLMVRCPHHWNQDCAIFEKLGEQAAAPSANLVINEQDELFECAVEIVVRTQTASISLLQRHFKLGYRRAARLMDALESAQVVSAPSVEGTRRVMRPTFREAGPPDGDA